MTKTKTSTTPSAAANDPSKTVLQEDKTSTVPKTQALGAMPKRRNQFRNRFRRHLLHWQDGKVKRFKEFQGLYGDDACFSSFSGSVVSSFAATEKEDTMEKEMTPIFYPIWTDVVRSKQTVCHKCLLPIVNNNNNNNNNNTVMTPPVITTRHPVFLKWLVYHQSCVQ